MDEIAGGSSGSPPPPPPKHFHYLLPRHHLPFIISPSPYIFLIIYPKNTHTPLSASINLQERFDSAYMKTNRAPSAGSFNRLS